MYSKLISAVMATVLVLSPLTNKDTDQFYNADKSISFEMAREEQVNKYIGEINRIVAEENIRHMMSDEVQTNLNIYKNLEEDILDSAKIANIERKLESLGAHKINPNSEKDMKLLAETTAGRIPQEFGIMGAEPAPDLAQLAGAYSLYIYNGTRNYSGKSYNYRYIKVVDDKGSNGLTLNHSMNAVGKGKGAVAADVLTFNLQYIFSSLLTSNPIGIAADWTMQNIFNVISSNSTVTYSSNANLYEIKHCLVTAMTYYYVDYYGWNFAGAGAYCDALRVDTFIGNVNGKPKSEMKKNAFVIKTSWLWYDYVDAYLKNPYAPTIKELGSFKVVGQSSKATLTPQYYRYPGTITH